MEKMGASIDHASQNEIKSKHFYLTIETERTC